MTIDSSQVTAIFQRFKLKKLTPEQVKRIDEMLASVGEDGEVHLVVKNGELRYINKVESFKARKNDVFKEPTARTSAPGRRP
jgi:hypothetical protein